MWTLGPRPENGDDESPRCGNNSGVHRATKSVWGGAHRTVDSARCSIVPNKRGAPRELAVSAIHRVGELNKAAIWTCGIGSIMVHDMLDVALAIFAAAESREYRGGAAAPAPLEHGDLGAISVCADADVLILLG